MNAIVNVHTESLGSDRKEHTLGLDLRNLREYLEAEGQAAVNEIDAWADDAGVQCITDIVIGGPPYKAILEYADQNDIDLIVMGIHGRTDIGRWLQGSVTEKVVRHADIPVLSVHPTEP